jgi:nucleoside-diphosphate-sugar epimerase
MPAITALSGPVAVTGVSGYTGGHMVRELVHHGYQVRACLRDATSWRGEDAIAYLEKLPGVTIFDGCDLFVPGSFDEAFRGCVGVFHVAAVLGNSASEGAQPNASGDRGKDTYEGGLTGTQNVIDAINKSGSVQRLVYTSSTSAVANASKGAGHEWTETDWASDGHDVDSTAWQTNYYGRSKVDTEHLVNAAAVASGVGWDVVTMNPAMICGPILFKAQNGQYVAVVHLPAHGTDAHSYATDAACASKPAFSRICPMYHRE